jgi:hypothetical protein
VARKTKGETGGRLHRILDRAEGACRRGAARLATPRGQMACLTLLIVMAVLVRLPTAFPPQGNPVVGGHPDEATYFNKAFSEYLSGPRYPLAHGGSGLPLVLEQVFRLFGLHPGPAVPQAQPSYALSADQRQAAYVATAFCALLGVGAVAGVFLIARQVLPPSGALAATALAVFDPALLRWESGQVMSEGGYAVAVLLALAFAVKSRQGALWLVPAAILLAVAHMFRVNGLIIAVMVLTYALLYSRRASLRKFQWKGVVLALLAFFLVLTPYLAWRADSLPGPFDYGTNQRFFADSAWNFKDVYWQNYTYSGGGHRETFQDYLATHSASDFLLRAYNSLRLQVIDFVGGGASPGERADGPALTPWLVAASLATALYFPRRREFWFFPLTLAFTFATFVWIYPAFREVRHFSLMAPLAAIFGMPGLRWLAQRTSRPALVMAAFFGTYAATFAVLPLASIPDGLRGIAQDGRLAVMAAVMTAFWLAITLVPHWKGLRHPARAPEWPPETTRT